MYPEIKLLGYGMGSFPLCIGIGLFFGTVSIFLQLKRMQASPERENAVMLAIPLTFIIGIAGAHITDIFLHNGIKSVIQTPLAYGLTFYGWLIFASAFLLLYAKKCSISATYLLNLFCPAVVIAQAWGRLGCFLGGCCYGIPAEWGIRYPYGSLPHNHYGNTPLIPVQIYESVYLAVVYIILTFAVRFKRRGIGYLFFIPCGRFILEFFRGDDRGALLEKSFSPSQWISIVLFAIGMYWMISTKKQGENNVIRKQ